MVAVSNVQMAPDIDDPSVPTLDAPIHPLVLVRELDLRGGDAFTLRVPALHVDGLLVRLCPWLETRRSTFGINWHDIL